MTLSGEKVLKAFTLVELLLGMVILSLVAGSVYSALQVGVKAFQEGQYNMELYQTGRIAMRKVSDELQFALSPHSFWQPQDTYLQMTYEEFMASLGGEFIQEKDPGEIQFQGKGKSVLYVRKIYQLDRTPPFDLQECRIFVEEGKKRLILQVLRSLLDVKKATWAFQREFQINMAGRVIPHQGGQLRVRKVGMFGEPLLEDYIGDYGMRNQKYLIADDVEEISFRYSDGKGWKSSWDSKELITQYRISPQSPRFNMMQHSFIEEKGPPLVVEIQLKLINGDTLVTSTDVPAGNMRSVGGRFPGGGAPPPPTIPRNETAAAAPPVRG